MQDRVNVCTHVYACLDVDCFVFCVAKIVCAQPHQGRWTVRQLANRKNGKGVNIIVDWYLLLTVSY